MAVAPSNCASDLHKGDSCGEAGEVQRALLETTSSRWRQQLFKRHDAVAEQGTLQRYFVWQTELAHPLLR